MLILIGFIFLIIFQRFKRQTRVNIKDDNLVLVQIVDHMPQKCSFTNTSLPHDQNWNVEAHPLNNKAHLKEIININNIARLAINFVLFIT